LNATLCFIEDFKLVTTMNACQYTIIWTIWHFLYGRSSWTSFFKTCL